MQLWVGVVMGLNMMVNFLLLLGAERMCGYPPVWRKTATAALVSGAYAGACLLPELSFLGNALWRVVFLVLVAYLAFGLSVSAIRRGLLFMLLHLALAGITRGLDKGGIWALPVAAVGILVLCGFSLKGRAFDATYLPVELCYGDKQLTMTALADTGNTLKDPVTGSPVLVVGAEVAGQLLGLTKQQLQKPVETLSSAIIPGLRLIPYKTVGQPCGMLLAMRIKEVKVGSWKGSTLVAFAPDGLSGDGTFQALTGGYI